MSIKIATKLPEDTRANGLATLQLSEGESTEVVVVMRMASTSISHLFATDDDVFTLAIAECEPLFLDEAGEAIKLMARARSERLGEYPLDEDAT